MKKILFQYIIGALSMILGFNFIYAQKKDFAPLTPPENFWATGEEMTGETFYTETPKMAIDFWLMDKKVDAITVQNLTTQKEITIFSQNDKYTGDLFLREGLNHLLVWSTQKRKKFTHNIRVFYNPYKATTGRMMAQRNCEIKLSGNYKLTPQMGTSDIIISRYSKQDLDINVLIDGCEDKALKVNVENPKSQPIPARRIGNNLYSFNARLFDYKNPFTVRVSCKGETAGEQKILVNVDREIEARLDTAIIFAVNEHSKQARRLGWEDLRYSVEDAQALKWTLENKFGFHVQILENPSWEQMNETMEGLKNKQWNRLDQLFVFFTGHGYRAPDGAGYLVPSNVGASLKTLYKMEDLRSQIDEIGCNNIALMIDACFASTFLERGATDIPTRKGNDIHHLLSSDLPFRYFIGSAPSNQKATETVYNKDSKQADGKYRYLGRKFRVSEFMMSFLESIEIGEDEFGGNPIPVWYVGRQVEAIYRPKKLIAGQKVYARTSRFGSQNDKGFHFINKNALLQ